MNRQIWNSQNGAASTIPAMKATLTRIRAPPKTSVTSSAQSPEDEPVSSARLSAGIEQYGARMNAPSPWSYHQKHTAVATSTNNSASATRLRSSRRCAIRLIVAAGSRGGRRRPAATVLAPRNRQRVRSETEARAASARARASAARSSAARASASQCGTTGSATSPCTTVGGAAWPSSFMPFISPLKMRSERPSERLASGSFLYPNSSRTARRMRPISRGPRFTSFSVRERCWWSARGSGSLAEARGEAAEQLSPAERVEDEDGQGREHDRGRDRGHVDAVLPLEVPQRQGQRPLLRALDQDQGQQEVVPDGKPLVDAHRHQRRAGQR